MNQYGDFTQIINRLSNDLAEVRSVWVDATAMSYDIINENMEYIAQRIWGYYTNTVAGYDVVKQNYNEGVCDDEINMLHMRMMAV